MRLWPQKMKARIEMKNKKTEKLILLEFDEIEANTSIRLEFTVYYGEWEYDPHLGVTFSPEISFKDVKYNGIPVTEKPVQDFLWDMHYEDISNEIKKRRRKKTI